MGRGKGSGVGQSGRTGLGPPVGSTPVTQMTRAERFAEATDLLSWAGQLDRNPPSREDWKMQRIVKRLDALGVTEAISPGDEVWFDPRYMQSTRRFLIGDRVKAIREGLVFHADPKKRTLEGSVALRKVKVVPIDA